MKIKVFILSSLIFYIIYSIFYIYIHKKEKPKIVSPLPGSPTIAKDGEIASKSISYYITTSQEFLNKARELAELTSANNRQQTEEEKQKIVALINQALDLANQAIANYPLDDRGFSQRAKIYQALIPFLPQAVDFAIQDLKEATKINNQNPLYYQNLAELYLQKPDFEAAALAFYNAHLLNPTDVQIIYNLAEALEKSGQLKKAQFYLEKLISLLPSNDQNLPSLQAKLGNIKNILVAAELKYLSTPGENIPNAPSETKSEIIGTQELPIEQAVLAQKLIIASDTSPRPISPISKTEINAKSGEGVLTAGQTEVTIENKFVASNTQIIISPKNKTENRVIFLKARKDNSWFKVGIDKPADYDIIFNWWIVE